MICLIFYLRAILFKDILRLIFQKTIIKEWYSKTVSTV